MPKHKRYKKRRRYSKRRRGLTKRSVKAIVRKAIKPSQNVVRLAHGIAPSNLSQNFGAWHLNPIASSSPIFGSGPNDVHRNQARHISLVLDVAFRAGNEADGSNLTAYIVSLKNDCKDSLFDSKTGTLSLVALEDYEILNGAAFINPRVFTIHKRWSILFPHAGSVTTSAWDTLFKRRIWKSKPRNYIKNERGDWGDLAFPQKPSHNYFLIVFNDNLVGDLAWPTVEFNVLNTYIA